MAGCPYCQTPVRDNARFCHACGASLLLPEFDRAFCPQCGARVRSRQWFCQECQWPLDSDLDDGTPLPETLTLEEPGPPALVQPAPVPPSPPRKQLFVIGLLVAVLVLPVLVWALMRRLPPATGPLAAQQEIATSPTAPVQAPGRIQPAVSPPPPKPLPATPEADPDLVRRQVVQVLDNLRAAQLEKDPVKLLASYAGSFPGLHGKYQKTLAVWKRYNYLVLTYDVAEVSVLDPKNLMTKVTWELETENRATREREKATFSYKVWFVQEAGSWRIKKLAPGDRPQAGEAR